MSLDTFISKKEIQIQGKTFVISKFPAFDYIEINAKLLPNSLPKIGDIDKCLDALLMVSKFCAVKVNETEFLVLSTKSLINNHFASFEYPGEAWSELILQIFGYNNSFFQDGKFPSFFQDLAENLQEKITVILTNCLGRLSHQVRQP